MSNSLRVLIVDDDAVDRQATHRALLASDLDVEVAEADRGVEALNRLTSEGFDAVLLDLQIPDGDGLGILREMQARSIATPIIMLTGHGDEMVAVEMMKAGAADYLSKAKLTPESLARTLRAAVRIGRAEVEAIQAEADRGRLHENLAVQQGQMEAVLTSITDGLVVSDLDGNILAMNPAALTMLGYQGPEDVQRPLEEFTDTFTVNTVDGRELGLEEWPLSRALRGETFSDFEVRVCRRDTGRTWTISFSGTPARGRTGEAILAVVTMHDITKVKEAQQRVAFLAEAGAILASSLETRATLKSVVRLATSRLVDWCAVNVQEPSGEICLLAAAHADPDQEERMVEMQSLYPLDPNASLGVGHVLRTGEPQLVADVSEDILGGHAQAAEHGRRLRALGIHAYLCVPLWARQRVLGTLSFASTQNGRTYGADDLALAEDLGQRISAALDNARLLEEAQWRAEREALINQIGQALRVTLDMDEILRIVTERVGQALKVSRCLCARLSPARDALEVLSQQYAAPGVPGLAFVYRLADCPPGAVEAWEAGRPVASQDHGLDRVSLDADGRDLTRAFIACPIFLRGQFNGLFIAQQSDEARVWATDEVDFLGAVADILALALENARLYAREHRVADMLQSAFLTDIPDRMPGLTLGANYSTGLDESRVGGDYYDAFHLPDGRVGLVIADVSGKGLSAAVQTATVKYSLRAFATEAAAPGLVLTRLNKLLCSDTSGLGDHFVTLFYAAFDPTDGRLAWTGAGHETMIIKRAGGSSDLLESNGPILGVADHTYAQATDYLGPGDALILYTDGLTEARGAGSREMLDLTRVRDMIEAMPPEVGAGALAARLQEAAKQWTGGRPQDDMALMVARRTEASEEASEEAAAADDSRSLHAVLTWKVGPGSSRPDKAEPDTEERLFAFRFSCRADCAAEVRQAVGHWMPALGFDRAATEDFQTAVTEAVTNAVRHGSPAGDADELSITGHRTPDGALRIEVTDRGTGIIPSDLRSAMPDPDAPGGRGLPLMQHLADAVEFRPTAEGHSVVLFKRPTRL